MNLLINSEWRELSVQDFSFKSEKLPENFGYAVSQEKCGDQYRYPLLSKFMMQLLSLPHCSASAERIFSVLNNIKTKNRNSLRTETINALMRSKSMLEGLDCTKCNPPREN